MLQFDTFHLHTKFSNSRFSRSGDMTAGVKIKNGSCDPDQALLGVVCHKKLGLDTVYHE